MADGGTSAPAAANDGGEALGLRVLEHAPGPPAWNMAVDEALLLGEHPATLRLYGWQPHAISLGYFQDAAAFATRPPGVELVRRTTGGGAIFHGDELTIALVVDAALLPGDVDLSYARIHDAIATALLAAGIPATRLRSGAEPSARPDRPWCFASPSRNDLVTAAGKLLGSAQRRIRRPRPRVLHHGSLVLQRPQATPFVAAVADVAEPATLLPTLRSQVVARLAAMLALEPVAGNLSAAESALAAQLRDTRYLDPRFTAGRIRAGGQANCPHGSKQR